MKIVFTSRFLLVLVLKMERQSMIGRLSLLPLFNAPEANCLCCAFVWCPIKLSLMIVFENDAVSPRPALCRSCDNDKVPSSRNPSLFLGARTEILLFATKNVALKVSGIFKAEGLWLCKIPWVWKWHWPEISLLRSSYYFHRNTSHSKGSNTWPKLESSKSGHDHRPTHYLENLSKSLYFVNVENL